MGFTAVLFESKSFLLRSAGAAVRLFWTCEVDNGMCGTTE